MLQRQWDAMARAEAQVVTFRARWTLNPCEASLFFPYRCDNTFYAASYFHHIPPSDNAHSRSFHRTQARRLHRLRLFEASHCADSVPA